MSLTVTNPSYDRVYTIQAWRDNNVRLVLTQGEGATTLDGTVNRIKVPRFQLRDEQGEMDLSNNPTVTLALTRPDGSEDLLACDIVTAASGIVACPITASATAIAGNASGEIRIIASNGVIKFYGIHFLIYKGVSDSAAAQSTQLSALIAALQKLAVINPDGSNTVEMDTVIVENGTNPVASGVIYDALVTKMDKLSAGGSNGVFVESYEQGVRRTIYSSTTTAEQVAPSATDKLLTAAIADGIFERQTDFNTKYNYISEIPNLFILESQVLDGITVTDHGDGTYTFNGTNTATTLFQAFLLSAGRYTASAEILSGTATNQFAVKYGSNNETWISTNIASATVLFTAATAVYFRLNLGTFTNFRLKISIEKENVYTAIDTVARAANSAAQAQLVSLSAQAGPLYPLVEPDGFTWKNSPLHGKILTDFRGVYQVDFDVASCKNNPGKVLYVSPDGSDSNAGTPDAPLANMSTAYNNGADTIYLYPGIYNLATSIFGTTINRDLNIIGLGEGVIISTRIINIPNTSPNVTEYSTGVWRCYSNGTTYLSNVVDIAHKTSDGHFTKYTQIEGANASQVKAAVQATAGSWALIEEAIVINGVETNKIVAYIHTLSGENPLAGDDVLLLYSPAPTLDNNENPIIYPLIKVTGGKVYFENLTCIEGTTPLLAQRQANGSDIEIYAKNCNFFYSRTEDHDACMLYGTTLSIFQNCEASFSQKDGFGYHAKESIIPKGIEINCIGAGNGNVEDGNDQGSTMHNGGSIIRVRNVCFKNYGANYADQGTGTESWNIGCVGFESLTDPSYSGTSDAQKSNFFAYDNTKVFCDGCVGFGSLYNVCTSGTGTIYLRNSRFEGTLTKSGMTPIYY